MTAVAIRRTSPEERRRILETLLLVQGAERWKGFTFLMTLSIVVATMGLSLDSAAVVIGAMLLAPLMTPIMGFAAAMTMGWPGRMLRMGLVVAVTSAAGALLAWLIAWAVPGFVLTGEILARTRPDTRDLVVALAAGAAGAYATARENVSGALPGVAVAVALVPPLATVGITLEQREYDLARGAMLLYATNLFAIVLVSAVILVIAGFVPFSRLTHVSGRLASGMLAMTVALVLVAVPLAQSSLAVADRQETLDAIQRSVERWLAGSPALEVEDVALDGSKVTVTLGGPEEPPDPEPLATDVATKLGREVTISVGWIQRSQGVGGDDERGEADAVAVTEADLKPLVVGWLRDGASGGRRSRAASIELDGSKATITVVGPVAPPSVAGLVAAVREALGATLEISVRWGAERDFAIDTTSDAEAIARNAANRWIGDRTNLLVEAVEVRRNTVIVDLVGERKPSGAAALIPVIRREIGGTFDVRIRFTRRELLAAS